MWNNSRYGDETWNLSENQRHRKKEQWHWYINFHTDAFQYSRPRAPTLSPPGIRSQKVGIMSQKVGIMSKEVGNVSQEVGNVSQEVGIVSQEVGIVRLVS